MSTLPHNLVNVPDYILEEEQVCRAIARTENAIDRALEAVGQMRRKQQARLREICRQRVRRAKEMEAVL